MKTEPNKAVVPRRLLVTDHACACSAPSNRLAHLERSAKNMKTAKIVLAIFLLFVAGYMCFSVFIRGFDIWILDFGNENGNASLAIRVNSDSTNKAKIIFQNSQPFNQDSIALDQTNKGIPNGKVVFGDDTVRPGRYTLEIKNHKIDIMSRALIIDGIEYVWSPKTIVKL